MRGVEIHLAADNDVHSEAGTHALTHITDQLGVGNRHNDVRAGAGTDGDTVQEQGSGASVHMVPVAATGRFPFLKPKQQKQHEEEGRRPVQRVGGLCGGELTVTRTWDSQGRSWCR